MVNVPPEIAPAMHKQLFEEIQWAQEDQPNPENWNFANYLMITSSYTDEEEVPTKQKKQKKKPKNTGETFYFKPEDEIYSTESFFSYSYPLVKNDSNSKLTLDSTVEEHRVILAFSASKVSSIVQQIEVLIPMPSN